MLKKVSAIITVRYKSVRYVKVFLWKFDSDSTGYLKKLSAISRCPLYSMSAIDRFVRYVRYKLIEQKR